MTSNTYEITVTITRMFNGCPKPDGWFGCYAYDKTNNERCKITGRTSIPLKPDMKIKATVEENDVCDYKMLSFEVLTDTTRSMTAYLKACPYLNDHDVDLIMAAFGIHAMSTLMNDPDTFQKKTMLNDKKLEKLEGYTKEITARTRLKNMVPTLTDAMIKKIIMHYDNPIAELKTNPYSLLSLDIPWHIVDNIALNVAQVDYYSNYRINHGICHAIERYINDTGNTCINLNDVENCTDYIQILTSLLGIQYHIRTLYPYLQQLSQIEEVPLIIETINNHIYLYNTKYHRAECNVAQVLSQNDVIQDKQIKDDILYEIQNFMQDYNISLSAEQQNAVYKSLLNRFSIITGGPGTGKTTITKCIYYVYKKIFHQNITLAAPTGRASKRLADSTKKPSMTIAHMMVAREEFRQQNLNKTNRYKPYDGLLIIDEASMLDILEAASILTFCNEKNHKIQIIFIGDIHQLPPIEPGQFFHDIVKSQKIPISYLNQCFRNHGVIENNAEKINNGDTKLTYDLVSTMIYPQLADDQNAFDYIIDTYNMMRTTTDTKEIALVGPMQKGPIGIKELNLKIHDMVISELNPQNYPKMPTDYVKHPNSGKLYTAKKGFPIPNTFYGDKEHWCRLRIGSRVMQTINNREKMRSLYKKNKNYFLDDPDSYQTGVYNGDTGTIIAYYPGDVTKNEQPQIAVEMDDNSIVHYDCSLDEQKELVLAYAMTIHKAQGSEYERGIIVMPQKLLYTPYGFATRNLFYTAFTRMRESVTIIGSQQSVDLCINTPMPERNSNLSYRL